MGAWESVTLGQMWAPLAGFGVLVMAVGVYFRLMHPWVKQAVQFLRDWAGVKERPGYDAIPGFPERMQAMEKSSATTKQAVDDMKDAVAGMQRVVSDIQEAVKDIRYQVKPNGGGSSHDAIMSSQDAAMTRINQIADAVPCPIPEPETPGATLMPPAPGAEAP